MEGKWKLNFSTPDRGSNPDLPLIVSLVQHESDALNYTTTKAVAVVVTFFICWAPFHAQRLLAVYGGGDAERRPSPVMIIIYSILTYTSGILYYLSTTVNPVLYHIMSNKFREAFKYLQDPLRWPPGLTRYSRSKLDYR
uniref:G-protein coupled receptors family 1 profile domain-containing protein n=1 Tax=Timema cristinae TaxID=61476 RepID=A0A7R9CN10_TIMCR|nr:unnamed protein product [Timema cristinae]